MIADRVAAAYARLEPDLVAFLQRLVRIPSVPGAEATAHECAANAMRTLGYDVEILWTSRAEVASHPAFCDDGLPIETRPNVIGRWRAPMSTAGQSASSLILNGHLDVVSPGDESRWTHAPWSAEIVGRRLYGRGACDMKAGVAAAVFAPAVLREAGIAPQADVLIETVSGEESGGIGTLATIVKGYRAHAAIILEPTGLALCPVQAGALTFRLVVSGQPAHGALKQSGVSAIDNLRVLLDAIDGLERDRSAEAFALPADRSDQAFALRDLYPAGQSIAPISVGVVRAGDWPSTVPDAAVAEGRYGIFPGESLAAARRQFEAAIAVAARAHRWLDAHPPRIEWFEGQFESGLTPLDAPVVRALSAAHGSVTSQDIAVRGVTYGSDLRLFTNHAGIPAVLYGPGHIEQAHAIDEFVDLDEVRTACTVVALTIAGWPA